MRTVSAGVDSQSRVSLLVQLFLETFVLGEMSLSMCSPTILHDLPISCVVLLSQQPHISTRPPTLVSMDTGRLQAAAAKLLRVLGDWTRLVSKLQLLSNLRGLWGTLGRYLQTFKGLE